MSDKEVLRCRHCGWEATVGTDEKPIEASQAAIDHYLIFGHTIERVTKPTQDYKINSDHETDPTS